MRQLEINQDGKHLITTNVSDISLGEIELGAINEMTVGKHGVVTAYVPYGLDEKEID